MAERKPVPPATRRALWERCNGACEWCGEPYRKEGWEPANLSIHHRVGVGAGGDNSLENLLVLCRPCHKRGDKGNGSRTGRPPKDETEKYIARQIKLPPALAEKLDRLIPEGRRSQFIRDALTRALKRVERQEKDDPHA